jgi:hypothetical protein
MADYTVQGGRFQVLEGLGCTSDVDFDGLGILLVTSWTVTLPLYSTIVYCRKFSQ